MSFYQFNSHIKLNADPIHPLHAVTKQYVDSKAGAVDGNRFQTGTLAVSKLPGLVGDVNSAQGTNNLLLVDSGVSPGVKFRVDVDAKGRVAGGDTQHHTAGRQISWSWVVGKPSTLAAYGITDVASKAGGTIGSALLSNIDASSANHAVRKSQVDTTLSNVNISSAVTGDIVRTSTEATPSGFLKVNGGVVSKETYAALYAVIGNTFTTGDGGLGYMGQPWRQQYAFNTQQSMDITGWATGTSLPAAVDASQAIVTKNRVYLLGGEGSSTVYTAPINADGTLGAWTAGTSLPATVSWSQAIVTKNRVYLLGGVGSAAVYTAPINADGTMGAWTTGTSLPATVGYSQAIVTKNRVYLLGGIVNGSDSSIVYTAPINADGTLGTWTTGTSLPATVYFSQAIVTKNRVYLLGGVVNGSYSSTVYTAPINADGTLGTWTTGTSLPATVAYSQAIVTKNRVYLLGGHNGSSIISIVHTAPINADGTLGSWTTGPSLPSTVYGSQAIVTKNRVYLLGRPGSSAVYTAPFAGGTNDYLTLIADNTVDTTTQFKLPDWTAKQTIGLYYYIKY